MTQGEEPRRAPLGAGPPSDQTSQPLPNGSGGPSWPALPADGPGAPRLEKLAVVALVLAVVSLLVPVFPGIAALVLATVVARRARALPAGAVGGGRGLVAVACAVSTIGVVAWVGLGALVIAQRQEPAGWHVAAATPTADRFSQVTTPPTSPPLPTEPAATEPPTTKPTVTAGRIGDPVTVSDEFGVDQFEVTVTKVKFSTGDEFEQPEHGLFMGAYVRVRALADDQDTVSATEMFALVGGHRYAGDPISFLRTFDPPLDFVLLDNGQRAAGWLVFDVPARHGRLVLRDIIDEHQLAAWKY